jgi:hypothetical protein
MSEERNILGIPVKSIVQPLAAQLAHMDSNTQALFFKVFADELAHACDTHWGTMQQVCFIATELSDKQKEVYQQLGFKE